MADSPTLGQRLYPLEPQYHERVWGGQRLKAGGPPVGEAWVACAESRVGGGAHAGRTVGELAAHYGPPFLGAEVFEGYGGRFPLIVKLLDCADWLSMQVHPDDAQAARLVGPGEFGKTEGWHFIEAAPGASIYAGVRAGTTAQELSAAIREGRVLDVAERFEVRPGDTLCIPSGTLHALGPGLLLYEVQQASDITFRVYDWGRPASAGRALHVEESVAVADPRRHVTPAPAPALEGTAAARALTCAFFELDVVRVGESAFEGDAGGRTFHLLTPVEGAVEISCGDERVRLRCFETALVAGGAGSYRLRAEGPAAKVLRAAVPRQPAR
jgi:mannose-6-phosphate isomerase